MPDISILGVTGTDGEVPLYNPNGLWQWWSINDIYLGTIGQHRHVPKINDYVIDPDTFTTYRVDLINPVTLIPTLVEIRPGNTSFTFNTTDVLFGTGPGTQSDTYRVYIDKSVTPHILAVDVRLKIAGSMSNSVKIFKGADLTTTGQVVSKVYDSNGNFISDQVPLELVAIDSHINYSIKSIAICHTTTDLIDGEIVTAVVYNDQGHVVSKRQLLVEVTSFIRSVNSSLKYVSHISLESAFLSPTLDHVIQFPLNIPLNALNLMGVVHYSDGSTLRLPVDGTKFRMFGLEQYVSSIVGQTIDLVLSYALSPGETAYAGVTSDNHYVTEPYSLVTTNPNNSYTVKLYGYPVWVDVANGYTMQWWLFNLDRNLVFDVTPYVRFAANTGAFNPKAYGFLQRKSVSINLKDVSGAFGDFIHTQLVDIVLLAEPDINAECWTVAHESISTRVSYGLNLYATQVNGNQLLVHSNISSFDEWLQQVYKQTYPLVNRTVELAPITPTHMVIIANGITTEFPISDWQSALHIQTTVTRFSLVNIKFIKRTSNGDIQLSMAAMIVK